MKRPLPTRIGVIHLPPLPGSPGAAGVNPARVLSQATKRAVEEALVLEKSGFEGMILENFGDAPFYSDQVPPETVASMAIIASAVRSAVSASLGINVLRNDGFAALSIAAVSGANFIRVNVLSGVMATDQGVIEGKAAQLLRERSRLQAEAVAILADVHVKHAKSLSSDDLALAIEETSGRGGAEGVIVTGSTTGRAPSPSDLEQAISGARHCRVPLYLGSGVTPEGLQALRSGGLRSIPGVKLGFIVGSALRKQNRAGAPLDTARIRAWMAAAKQH